MQMSISYHQVDHSKALDKYINERSESVNRFISRVKSLNYKKASWVISKRGKSYVAALNLAGEKFYKSAEENPFLAVEKVLKKAMSSLRKLKEKRVKH